MLKTEEDNKKGGAYRSPLYNMYAYSEATQKPTMLKRLSTMLATKIMHTVLFTVYPSLYSQMRLISACQRFYHINKCIAT